MLYLSHHDRNRLRAVVRRVFQTHPEFQSDHPQGDRNCDEIIEKLGDEVMNDYLAAVIESGDLKKKLITGASMSEAKKARDRRVNARFALQRKLHYP